MSRQEKHTLNTILVSRAMRRHINRLPKDTSISNSINTLIKYKVNGLLTTDEKGVAVGVLSKTDIMGAYYADLPLNSPLEYIMSSPPLFCKSDDPLEKALEQMRDSGVYRLYVLGLEDDSVVGALAYPDIVGILYQYCCDCEYSHFRQQKGGVDESIRRLRVRDSMTRDIKSVSEDDSLVQAMEELSMYRMGAILVKDSAGRPAGVISKTDLILAYKHGVDPQESAKSVMSVPVQSCGADDLLEDAIRTTIFSDVHRLFVKEDGSDELVGVFSLTDAARNRSGSCQACISSRISIQTN